MFENPKLLYLKDEKQFKTIVIHLESMTYSGRHGLAGFIPKAALRVIGATNRDAEKLVIAGLWAPVSGGWEINGWDEYQVAGMDEKTRRDRAQKGAAARWAKAGKVVNLRGATGD